MISRKVTSRYDILCEELKKKALTKEELDYSEKLSRVCSDFRFLSDNEQVKVLNEFEHFIKKIPDRVKSHRSKLFVWKETAWMEK